MELLIITFSVTLKFTHFAKKFAKYYKITT